MKFMLFPFSSLLIIQLPETLSAFETILFNLMILALITLWCFIDIAGHFITLF
jgi:hypothetical protein